MSPIDAPMIKELFQNGQVKTSESEKYEDEFLTSADPHEQYVFQTSIDYNFIEMKWSYFEFGIFKRKRATGIIERSHTKFDCKYHITVVNRVNLTP